MIPDNELNLLERYALDDDAQKAYEVVLTAATDHVGTEHLVYGLLSSSEVMLLLSQAGVDVGQLSAMLFRYVQTDAHQPETVGGFTQVAWEVFAQADQNRQARGATEISPLDILLAILDGSNGMGMIAIGVSLWGREFVTNTELQPQRKQELAQTVRELMVGSSTT